MDSGSSSHENNLQEPQNEHSRSLALGRAQISIGYFLIVVGGLIGAFGFAALRPSPHKEIWAYLLGVLLTFVAACVVPLATRLLRRGRKHLALILPLDTVPAGDFVLYLRAFTDDIKLTEVEVVHRRMTGSSPSFITVPVLRTEEEQLRDAVRPFGFSSVSTWRLRGEINFALLNHTSSTVCGRSTSGWARCGLELKTYRYSQPYFQKRGPCVNNLLATICP